MADTAGRYCAESPYWRGVSLNGTDVVKENLRQICIWKHAKEIRQQHLWWDYVNDFADDCFGEEGVEDTASATL